MITECLLREITIEYLSARGERPYRILRGGSSLWETHVPAMRLALVSALQSVEGGVQGSIATKQESCPESAPRTETDVRWAVNYLLEQIAAKFEAWDTMDLWRSDAASLVRSFKHDLTKTPSADHDAGNLRGWSALFVECHRCGGSGFSSPGTGYGDVCSECGGLRFLPFEAAGKRPVPSVSGNTDREQQRNTMGVTAGETAPNSSAVAETRRDVPENAGLLSGVSSAPFSSTRKDERA